ncbi:MAG: formate/nitrite transporter family protein [Megasphaera sp.]|jgi:nitrite transporter NirC|uniref:formate/nitrite transporter family protein n=1 Tax=Megasphaera sueciensis TaxID=349094 RepID=UPI003CFC36D6|nr:formate/nitrite transporter family protein [Megasphaera sp.]MCI1823202.1 formate/nitrite transporter family protein [Megasphaera sp.]
MFSDEYNASAIAAKAKITMLENNPVGYFAASILAGAYIGFGILLIFTIGGMLGNQPYTKIIMGASFGIALSLVVIAGAELFTGNNFIMASGVVKKTIRVMDVIKLWCICYAGNWVGAVLLSLVFYGAQGASGSIGQYIAVSAAAKMGLSPLVLFLRGVLCNILVCLATWCGFRCKSDSGKLIMIFWCLFAFITCGFEHSIANMTLLTVSLLAPFNAAVSVSGYIYNLTFVTLGNIVGAVIFLSVPYGLMARETKIK